MRSAVGSRGPRSTQSRQVVRQPTLTLDELEMHVTTLNPGLASHPPHKHTNEELLILKEGTLEALVDAMEEGRAWVHRVPGVEQLPRRAEHRHDSRQVSHRELEFAGAAEDERSRRELHAIVRRCRDRDAGSRR
jgi:hypothetical protein